MRTRGVTPGDMAIAFLVGRFVGRGPTPWVRGLFALHIGLGALVLWLRTPKETPAMPALPGLLPPRWGGLGWGD